MHTIANLQPRYLHILEQIVSNVDVLAREAALAEAFDLGRVLLATAATPDNIVALHHETLEEYAQRHPHVRLDEVASQLTLPLMELTMAHGMASVSYTHLVEDAEGLLAWLQSHPKGTLDLSRCEHLHAANLQVLMAAHPTIAIWPLDASLANWLRQALQVG